MLWENTVFLNKNSSQVQAKHSLQAPFHLLKSCSRTRWHAHFFSPLRSNTERRCVTWRGTWTPNPDESSDATPWSCFQNGSCNTSKETEKVRAGETGERRKAAVAGTHSRPSLGLDWKRSSGRNWSLFLFRRLWKEKEGNVYSLTVSYCRTHLKEKPQREQNRTETHSFITRIHALVLTRLSPTGQLHHLGGQQVGGSKVKLMGKSAFFPAIMWPAGYHAAFCVCVSVAGYCALSSLKPVITLFPARVWTCSASLAT